MQMHTLNLDFCTSLTSLEKDCFACMPKLMRLSMCETRVSNLWTTTAALAKLPSLVELRFQNCLCCKDTRPCSASSNEQTNSLACGKIVSGQLSKYIKPPNMAGKNITHQTYVGDSSSICAAQSLTRAFLDDSQVKKLTHHQRSEMLKFSSDSFSVLNGKANSQIEVRTKFCFCYWYILNRNFELFCCLIDGYLISMAVFFWRITC